MGKLTSTSVLGAILAFGWVPSSAQALPADQVSLNKCQLTVGKEGEKLVRRRIKAIDTCLKKISIVLIKKNLADTSGAAKACVKQFRKLNDSRATKDDAEEKFRTKVTNRCDPGTNNHLLADLLGAGKVVPQSMNVENLNSWCENFGGDGSIDDLDEWLDCIVAAHTCEADQAVSVQYPRVLEWLADVKPFMQAVPAPATNLDKTTDAVAALDALDLSLDSDSDDVLDITCGPSAGGGGGAFPATGQVTCWNSSGSVVTCAGTGHDGEILAGAALSYTDNGDGTITDDNTGLMWEKKGDNGTIHDKDTFYTWDNAFAVHVAGLNTASFAGHTDWRVPNVKELQSIVDYEVNAPSVDSVFDTGCASGCTVTSCSCTRSSSYWSASTVAFFPTLAWVVGFSAGGVVNLGGKFGGFFVRAVRGGL